MSVSVFRNEPPVGTDFARSVEQGESITVLFSEEATPGGPAIVADPGGFTVFKNLEVSTPPEHSGSDVALNADGTGITYEHDDTETTTPCPPGLSGRLWPRCLFCSRWRHWK